MDEPVRLRRVARMYDLAVKVYGSPERGSALALKFKESIQRPCSHQMSTGRLGLSTQKAGDDSLVSLASPVARVPSAVVPGTGNYLLNPLHSDAARVHIVSQVREFFDAQRFLGRVR